MKHLLPLASILLWFFVGLISNLQAQDNKTYEQAIQAYQKGELDEVIDLCEQMLQENTNDDAQVKAYTLLGITYFTKKQYSASISNYKLALPIAKKINNPVYLAKIYSNIGVAYTWLDNYLEAKINLRQALLFLNQKNKQEEGNIFNNLGIAYRKNKQYDSARYYYQKALPLISSESKHFAINDVGLLFQYQSKYDSAQYYLTKGYELRKKQFPQGHYLINRSINNLAYNYMYQGRFDWSSLLFQQVEAQSNNSLEVLRSLVGRADVFWNAGKKAQALEMYKAADQIAFPIRQEIEKRADKEYFAQITSKLNQTALELSLALDDTESAFYFAERNKGSILLELTQARNSLGYSIPIQAREIQKQLGEKQALLSYALFGDSLATFVITQDTMFVHRQTKDSLELECRRFNATLEKYFGDKDYIQQSRDLYTRLIDPLAHLMADKKDLLIIPESDLFIPYGALLRSLPDTSEAPLYWDYPSFPYLLKDYTIHYHFSASLAFLPRPARSYGLDYLGLAPSFGEGYQELPYSILEVQGVKARLDQQGKKTRAYVGDDAKKEIIQGLSSKIFHLATHYHNGGLILRDSSLTLKDLYEKDYRIESELAVLSGCQTFLGRFVRGEGPINLVSHFIEAGSENVLFSFNKMYDGPGQKLVESFFEKHLAQGLSYAEAIRAAKLEVAGDPRYNHYVFWSGMGLISSEFAQVKD